MEIAVDEKKKEAVDRMRKIGLFPETIKQFETAGIVSETVPPLAACYWINDDQKARVKAFEEKYNALVYHVIHGTYLYGGVDRVETECFLYVSDYRDEWQLDRDDLDELQALCYVYNVTDPQGSEIGTIGFKVGAGGGLLRTW